MPVEFHRRLVDGSLVRTKHMPRPLEKVWCDSMDDDILPVVYFPLDIGVNPIEPEILTMELSIPATLLDDGQSVRFELLHSDVEQGPYVSMDPTITTSITGAGGIGTLEKMLFLPLSNSTKQFLVVSAVCDDGADISATLPSFSIRLLF